MYSYEAEKEKLFTDEGQRMFIKIRDNVKRLLGSSGAFTMGKATSKVTGDSWQVMACVDRLIELKEIVELTRSDGLTPIAQHRVFMGLTLREGD